MAPLWGSLEIRVGSWEPGKRLVALKDFLSGIQKLPAAGFRHTQKNSMSDTPFTKHDIMDKPYTVMQSFADQPALFRPEIVLHWPKKMFQSLTFLVPWPFFGLRWTCSTARKSFKLRMLVTSKILLSAKEQN